MSSSSHLPASTPNDGDRPWLKWPHELPPISEARQTPEFHAFQDEERHRKMHKEIRDRIFAGVSVALSPSPNSAILLAGGTSVDFELYDTDVLKTEFRQEQFFRYIFGVNYPDCYGIIDLDKKETVLFITPGTDESERWEGERRPMDYYSKRFGMDATHPVSELDQVLQSRGIKDLFTLEGTNLDSGNATRTRPNFPGMEKYNEDKTKLYPFLAELRVCKTAEEIRLLRLANLVSSAAHVYVMRHARAGLVELQLESLFKAWCGFFGAARHCAYTCICGSGAHGSILHYGHAERPNERVVQDGDRVVLDMGAEYDGYATDITRSYPINGKFTADQKMVHDAVVDAQQSVIKALKPGVDYRDMHQLAERVILKHLLAAGLLQGGSVDELMSAHMASVFMPHGLGHLLGMAVHDVGGYLPGENRTPTPGLSYLRLGRKLQAGMVLTVEPGIYFNQPTLDKALRNPAQSKYINQDVLKRFLGTGGCRMEDDVLITENGAENMTILPTTVEEIEQVMAEANKIRAAGKA